MFTVELYAGQTQGQPGVAEQLGGGWPSRGQIGAWLKRRTVLHVARRDVFVSVMTLLDEQTIYSILLGASTRKQTCSHRIGGPTNMADRETHRMTNCVHLQHPRRTSQPNALLSASLMGS